MPEENQETQGEQTLIFGKYKTMEEAEAAHKGLEKHFHDSRRAAGLDTDEEHEENNEPEEQKEKKEDLPTLSATEEIKSQVTEKGLDFDQLTAEVQEHGDLTPETRKALNKAGFTDAVINANLKAVQYEAEAFNQKIIESAGGKEAWDELEAWAPENLDAAELKALNKTLASGDLSAIRLALRGVRAAMGDGGFKGRLSGSASGNSTTPSGATPINNRLDLAKAMRDPRYHAVRGDQAYINWVDRQAARLAQ